MEKVYHIPALLKETVDGLNVKAGGVYVDCTYGGGGHSKEILRRGGKVIGLDQDAEAVARAEEANEGGEGLTLIRGNFRYIANYLRYENAVPVDGILADLGVSFHDFDTMERGFSFRGDGSERLDMRMNQTSETSAETILNTRSEEEIADIFYLYGELKESRLLARKIVKARDKNPLTNVGDLMKALGMEGDVRSDKKKWLSRIFQALRIEVNDEMGALKDLLEQSLQCLKPGGRLAILTYHSLEDRLVKNFMRTGNVEGNIEKDAFGNVMSDIEAVNRKPIEASEEEVSRNPRSRSAKLRIGEKKGGNVC